MIITRTLSAIAICASFTFPVLAGPVERELRARGGDVSVPIPRGLALPTDVLPADLPGGERRDTPARPQRETTVPAARDEVPDYPQTPPLPSRAATQEPETVKAPDPVTKPRKQRTVSEQCIPQLAERTDATSIPSPTGKYDECRIQQPVAVQRFGGPLPVALSTRTELDCVFAEAVADYIRFRLQPLAQIHLETELTELATGPGFTCRRRNNAATGKLSEHSFGYGLDITAFRFADGTRIDVQAAANMDERSAAYFNAARKAACTYFTTVLGPGSNAAHATHLHLDLGRSIGNSNPYRICE